MSRIRNASLLIVFFVALSACQPAPIATPAPTQEEAVPSSTTMAEETAVPEPTEAEEMEEVEGGPQQGGTLISTLGSDPQHLNEALSGGITVLLPASTMMEGLIDLDLEYNARPELAESWEISDDGLAYAFHLRPDVRWHDGMPFTSEDVKFTLEEMAPFHSRAKGVVENIASIEIPDDLTVIVTLDEPFGPFLDFLTDENVPMQPKHIFEGTDIPNNPANLAPIGTGPFKYESWVAGESVVVVRNDDYWDAPRPYLDRIIFQIVPDSSARVLALEAEEITHIVSYYVDIKEAVRLEDAFPGVVTRWGRMHPELLYLFYNNEQPPFDDPAVRKALFMAMDRELMGDAAYAGRGVPGTSSIPTGFAWAYNPDVDYNELYPYDPEAAAAMLDEAGHPVGDDGRRFEARLVFDPAQPGWSDIADIIRANWSEVGVEVTLEARERAVWIDQLFIQKDYDTALAAYSSGGDPKIGVERAFRCDEIRDSSFTNASLYCNPEVDELLNSAARAVDKPDRAENYYQVQEILADDFPMAVLWEKVSVDLISDQFGGLEAFFNSRGRQGLWQFLYVKP